MATIPNADKYSTSNRSAIINGRRINPANIPQSGIKGSELLKSAPDKGDGRRVDYTI